MNKSSLRKRFGIPEKTLNRPGFIEFLKHRIAQKLEDEIKHEEQRKLADKQVIKDCKLCMQCSKEIIGKITTYRKNFKAKFDQMRESNKVAHYETKSTYDKFLEEIKPSLETIQRLNTKALRVNINKPDLDYNIDVYNYLQGYETYIEPRVWSFLDKFEKSLLNAQSKSCEMETLIENKEAKDNDVI